MAKFEKSSSFTRRSVLLGGGAPPQQRGSDHVDPDRRLERGDLVAPERPVCAPTALCSPVPGRPHLQGDSNDVADDPHPVARAVRA